MQEFLYSWLDFKNAPCVDINNTDWEFLSTIDRACVDAFHSTIKNLIDLFVTTKLIKDKTNLPSGINRTTRTLLTETK